MHRLLLPIQISLCVAVVEMEKKICKLKVYQMVSTKCDDSTALPEATKPPLQWLPPSECRELTTQCNLGLHLSRARVSHTCV